MEMRVLITGANGFIGSHLLSRLSERSAYSAVGMVRKTSRLFRFKGSEYSLITASLEDRLDDSLQGFDAVIHTAARASDWGDYDDFYHTNVQGTLNLIESAIRSGVRRFIHLSSTVVYGFTGHINTDEKHEVRPFKNGYCVTKAIAEQKLFQYRDRIELFVLRPSNVFGPFDTTTTLPFLQAIDRGLAAFPLGGKTLTSPCFARNLVRAVELCLTAEKGAGHAFNISDGCDIRWREFLGMMAAALDKRPPMLSIPAKPLYGFSLVLDALFKLFHSAKPPLITPYRIAQASKNYSFSIEKAKKVLNYDPPFTTEEGVGICAEWYEEYKKSPVQTVSTPSGACP